MLPGSAVGSAGKERLLVVFGGSCGAEDVLCFGFRFKTLLKKTPNRDLRLN